MTNGNGIVDDITDDNNAFCIFNEWQFLHTLVCINVSLIFVLQKCLFYHLDQEYCLDSCQFVKYRSCKISAGIRFSVCVLRVESQSEGVMKWVGKSSLQFS